MLVENCISEKLVTSTLFDKNESFTYFVLMASSTGGSAASSKSWSFLGGPVSFVLVSIVSEVS